MENDIINLLFQKKTDNDLFDFHCKELIELEKKRSNDNKNLYAFIKKRVHPKSQEILENLIEEYINTYAEIAFFENKLYYHSGFLDGVGIIEKSLAKH